MTKEENNMKLLRNLPKFVLTMENALGYNAVAQRKEIVVITDNEARTDIAVTCGQGGHIRRIKPPYFKRR